MTCLPTDVQGILWEFAGPWTLRSLIHEAFNSQVDWFDEIEPGVVQYDQQQFGPDADDDMETVISLKVRSFPNCWSPGETWRMDWSVETCNGARSWRADYGLNFPTLEELLEFEPLLRDLLPARVVLPTPILALPEEEWEHLVGMEDMADRRDWVTLSSRANFLQGLKQMKEGAEG